MLTSTEFASYPSLSGRRVIITGGASGIGEALVSAFAEQAARVAILDIQEQAGRQLVQRLSSQGCNTASFHLCDLTDILALQRVVSEVMDAFDGLDVLVNNAGNDTRHLIEDVTPESWDRMMAINLKQMFFMTQKVIPAMKTSGRGSIINMSSIGWIIPSTKVPVYVTAKAAIIGMTRTLAHELGPHNIRVNSVLPGAILTERQRKLWFTEDYKAEILSRQALKRLLLPDEVARLVLFLAASDSSAITSQSYVVDGGWI